MNLTQNYFPKFIIHRKNSSCISSFTPTDIILYEDRRYEERTSTTIILPAFIVIIKIFTNIIVSFKFHKDWLNELYLNSFKAIKL